MSSQFNVHIVKVRIYLCRDTLRLRAARLLRCKYVERLLSFSSRCNMTLSSWTLDNTRLDLDFDGQETLQFSVFSESNEWMLVESRAWKNVELEERWGVRLRSHWSPGVHRAYIFYDSPTPCTLASSFYVAKWMLVESSAWKHLEWYDVDETKALAYTKLIYSMTIKRRVGFYVYALIIPSVLLSFLMPLTFWIPTSGDGRITLGIYFCHLYNLLYNYNWLYNSIKFGCFSSINNKAINN